MSLKDLYIRAKRQPKPATPAISFIREVSAVTKKSEITVRKWLGGEAVPDELTQKTLAEHFGTTPEELFPVTDKA